MKKKLWSNAAFWVSPNCMVIFSTDDYPEPNEIITRDQFAEKISERLGRDFARELAFSLVRIVFDKKAFIARKLLR